MLRFLGAEVRDGSAGGGGFRENFEGDMVWYGYWEAIDKDVGWGIKRRQRQNWPGKDRPKISDPRSIDRGLAAPAW